ncbi:MAG TPA: hypothetical protein VE174_09765 [Actinomycetota bacterium]|nr:hypothetical protein [Actinomycetota bacterium]
MRSNWGRSVAVISLVLLGCGPVQVDPRVSIPSLPTASSGAGDAGARIVFEKSSDIYSMDRRSKHRRRLTDKRGLDYIPQWSPDRSKIAFLHFSRRQTSLWVMRRDGSSERKVADNVVEHYDWSPDSDRLVYTLRDDPGLFTVRTDGSDKREISSDERLIYGPDWSPDGTSIAITGGEMQGDTFNQDIFVVDIADGDIRRLTTDPAQDWQPRWSPDSSTIAFLTARNDPYDSEYGPYTSGIYAIDADGSNERELTTGDKRKDQDHMWSPDGSRLVFVRTWDDDVAPSAGAGSHLRIYSLDDGRSVPMASPKHAYEPKWSPSGRWILYTIDDKTDAEIWRIQPEGETAVRLTNNDEHDTRPDW